MFEAQGATCASFILTKKAHEMNGFSSFHALFC
jgi:hypothetical protein